jgi:hypothetical protein
MIILPSFWNGLILGNFEGLTEVVEIGLGKVCNLERNAGRIEWEQHKDTVDNYFDDILLVFGKILWFHKYRLAGDKFDHWDRRYIIGLNIDLMFT